MSTPSDPPRIARSSAKKLLSLSGPIGAGEIAGVQRRIGAALDGDPHDLVIDLRGVWAFSSEAVSVLVGAASRQHAQEQHLTLIYAAGSPIDTALKSAVGDSGAFTTVWAIPDWGPVRRTVRGPGRPPRQRRAGPK